MKAPEEAEEIVIRYLVDEEHELLQQKALMSHARRLQLKATPRRRWLDLAVTLTVAVALLAIAKLATSPAGADAGWTLLFVAPLVVVLVLAGIVERRAAWRHLLAGSGPHPYEEVLRIGTETLTISNPRGLSIIPLRRVVEVTQMPSHLMLNLRAGVGILVPNSAIADGQERERLIARVRGANLVSPLPPGEG
jgi:hypothetical protein